MAPVQIRKERVALLGARAHTRVVLPCLFVSGLLGAKRISLREYLNNESGICHTINFDCPKKDSCEARKKAKNN